MKVRIEKDARGQDVLWTEVGGAHGGKAKPVPLPTETIFMRLIDGHIFIAPSGAVPLERLRPHEPEMVNHWLCEKAPEIAPNVFAGEPAPG